MKYLDLYLGYINSPVGLVNMSRYNTYDNVSTYNTYEMFQHCHMIMYLHNLQHLGLVDQHWVYVSATRNQEIKNMADAFFYNSILNEYITFQYKYKQNKIISWLDLWKWNEAYINTDIVQVGLANYNLYNEQILKIGNSSWKNIYFQNYAYLNTEVVDPNFVNYVFKTYNKNMTDIQVTEINKNYLNDLNKHHFFKPAKKLMLNQILYDNQNPLKLVNSNNLTHIE